MKPKMNFGRKVITCPQREYANATVNEMEKPEKGKSLDSQEYKFVMVGVPSEANDQDIARGIVESLIDKNITVNKVEFFYDKVANKRRKNAFISVDGQEELDFMLDDQTRAFGINVLVCLLLQGVILTNRDNVHRLCHLMRSVACSCDLNAPPPRARKNGKQH